MSVAIGEVEAIFRYPVKSMAGVRLEFASLGWHGIDGDRRLAFRRVNDHSGMPWLTAGKLPDLLLFTPHSQQDGAEGEIPTHIRTPRVSAIVPTIRLCRDLRIACNSAAGSEGWAAVNNLCLGSVDSLAHRRRPPVSGNVVFRGVLLR